METQKKIQNTVDYLCERADEYNSSTLAVCGYPNWNKDEWNHRNDIIQAIQNRGYEVSSKTNHGVLDITVVKPIKLK